MTNLNEKTYFAIDDLLTDVYPDIDQDDFYEGFSIQKLKDLCGKQKFLVFNETDGFYASHEEMEIEEAIQFMENFPKRFEIQGYYRTSRGEAIPPSSVRYSLTPYVK